MLVLSVYEGQRIYLNDVIYLEFKKRGAHIRVSIDGEDPFSIDINRESTKAFKQRTQNEDRNSNKHKAP